jgi:hypothetical protein
MRNSTLIGSIAAFPVLVGLMAIPAQARQAEGEPTGAFCALAGLDLLAALDGSWTIRQGPGQAQAGVMTIPLPAPPPAPVTFKFDPQRRLVDVRSADLADGMIMFPAAPVQQAAADQLIGKPPTGNPTGPVCAWLTSPTLIGTNVYFALDKWTFFKEPAEVKWKCGEFLAAVRDPDGPEAVRLLALLILAGSPDDKKSFNYSAQWYLDTHCGEASPRVSAFEMEMTLVLRFLSKNSAAGMVYFEGKTDQARFRASAPVRFSR